MRTEALHAKYAQILHGLETALELYYQDHGSWPASSNGRMVITNGNTAQWNAFYNKIGPYMSGFNMNEFPYQVGGGFITQGFIYFKGTESNYVQQPMYNGVTGAYVGCIKIYDGYFFDLVLNSQTKFTLKDGGVDPDGIDSLEGHYIVDNTPVSSCPTSSVVY